MITPKLNCTHCGSPFPANGFPHLCPQCGGLFDYALPLLYDPSLVDGSQPGIWRYRFSFGLADEVKPVSLGEGNTPLVWGELFGRLVAFKCDYLNPTGSFKDRGTTLIVSLLKATGVSEVVEDSSGNAGASLAAYAARSGIKARIFIPGSASGPKRRQIEAYGSTLVNIQGTRSEVAEAVEEEASNGAIYASHAHLPFFIPGNATTAFEIFEQLGCLPGAVVSPVGQGGMLLGLHRGFSAIKEHEGLSSTPKLVGVQARACGPLWEWFKVGHGDIIPAAENPTLAEGVRVRSPVWGRAVLDAVGESKGVVIGVEEDDILPGRDQLARKGFYVEPTSAVVWDGFSQVINELPDPVVIVLTGVGYKYE